MRRNPLSRLRWCNHGGMAGIECFYSLAAFCATILHKEDFDAGRFYLKQYGIVRDRSTIFDISETAQNFTSTYPLSFFDSIGDGRSIQCFWNSKIRDMSSLTVEARG